VKALVVIPLPCPALLYGHLLKAASEAWAEGHPGETLTMAHLREQNTAFGRAVVIWDQPQSGGAP
jgi:hypothetical protein